MNFATIGTNFISKEFVSAGLKNEKFQLRAVYSRKQESAEEFISAVLPAESKKDLLIFTDLKELAECEGVDAVYVASPNIFHFEQAKMMLEHGKHVFVEKPAVISAAEFEKLIELAAEKKLVIMEGMRTIYTPGFIAVKKAMNKLGKIRRASLTYCQYSRRYDNYKKGIIENAFNPKLGNGAIMDIGVYVIAAMTALLGMPDEVAAQVMKLDNGLDYQGTVLCRYNEGILTDLSYGKVSDSIRWNEIEGEQGTFVFFPPTNPKKVVLKCRGGECETIFEDEDNEFYGMIHEISSFIGFCEGVEKEYSLQEVQKITLDSLSVIDTIRELNDINFL